MGNESTDEDPYLENSPLRKYTIQFLKENFEPHTVMTALSCAGNRRDEYKCLDKNV